MIVSDGDRRRPKRALHRIIRLVEQIACLLATAVDLVDLVRGLVSKATSTTCTGTAVELY